MAFILFSFFIKQLAIKTFEVESLFLWAFVVALETPQKMESLYLAT